MTLGWTVCAIACGVEGSATSGPDASLDDEMVSTGASDGGETGSYTPVCPDEPSFVEGELVEVVWADGLWIVETNRDVFQDLVYTWYEGENVVAIRLGDGPGTFGGPSYTDSVKGRSVGIGDPDGDGDDDIVSVGAYDSKVRVLVNDGQGGFDGRGAGDIASEAVADFHLVDIDLDGRDDLALRRSNGIAVYLADEDGRFPELSLFASVPSSGVMTWADLVGSPDRDLVVATLEPEAAGFEPDQAIRLFRTNGSALLEEDKVEVVGQIVSLASADLDGDGTFDVYGTTRNPATLLRALNEDGRLVELAQNEVDGSTPVIVPARLNCDAHPDAILSFASSIDAGATLLMGGGTGLWSPLALEDVPGELLTVADVNADGIDDLFFREGALIRVWLSE